MTLLSDTDLCPGKVPCWANSISPMNVIILHIFTGLQVFVRSAPGCRLSRGRGRMDLRRRWASILAEVTSTARETTAHILRTARRD